MPRSFRGGLVHTGLVAHIAFGVVPIGVYGTALGLVLVLLILDDGQGAGRDVLAEGFQLDHAGVVVTTTGLVSLALDDLVVALGVDEQGHAAVQVGGTLFTLGQNITTLFGGRERRVPKTEALVLVLVTTLLPLSLVRLVDLLLVEGDGAVLPEEGSTGAEVVVLLETALGGGVGQETVTFGVVGGQHTGTHLPGVVFRVLA